MVTHQQDRIANTPEHTRLDAEKIPQEFFFALINHMLFVANLSSSPIYSTASYQSRASCKYGLSGNLDGSDMSSTNAGTL